MDYVNQMAIVSTILAGIYTTRASIPRSYINLWILPICRDPIYNVWICCSIQNKATKSTVTFMHVVCLYNLQNKVLLQYKNPSSNSFVCLVAIATIHMYTTNMDIVYDCTDTNDWYMRFLLFLWLPSSCVTVLICSTPRHRRDCLLCMLLVVYAILIVLLIILAGMNCDRWEWKSVGFLLHPCFLSCCVTMKRCLFDHVATEPDLNYMLYTIPIMHVQSLHHEWRVDEFLMIDQHL
jgi:hypothetical protein